MKLDRRSAGLAVLAALAGLAAGAAPAQAQHGGGHADMSEAERGEMHRQITALLALAIAHADFEAVSGYFTDLIAANPEAIGGDTAALSAHVQSFLAHAAEHGRADPQGSAEHIVHVMMELHAPGH